MCITVFLWQSHPLYPLILLLNRDEYHTRPTKTVGWWEGGDIVGGRDEVAGGTWLACSRQGRVAFLTNVLELHTLSQAKSRGDLPVRFLKSKKGPKEFGEEVAKEAHEYNGFNLILADPWSKTMVYITNRPKGEPVTVQEVKPGIHVLSNAKLDTPWPKAKRLAHSFKEHLGKFGKEEDISVAEMAEQLMQDAVKAEENKLPHICSLDWEFSLSSIFVQVDTPLGRYGTRSTSGVTVKADGEVSFYEACIDRGMWVDKTVNYKVDDDKNKIMLKPAALNF